MMDAMKEALKKKRAQGVDLEIVVGGKTVAEVNVQPEGQTDKAPPMVGVVDEPGHAEPDGDESDPSGALESPVMGDNDEDDEPTGEEELQGSLEQMVDPEDHGDRQPKGLAARARMMNARKMKK